MVRRQHHKEINTNTSRLVNLSASCLHKFVTLIALCAILSLCVSNELQAAEWVIKTPRIRLFPPQGPAGTLVYVGVIDYPRFAPITILLDDRTIAELQTDESGYAFTSFVVENGAGGIRNITVKSDTESKTAYFNLIPRCLLSNNRASPGDVITISGTGLRPNVFLSVKIANQTVQTVTSSENGEISADIFVPEIGRGIYNLWLMEGERQVASLQVEVTPKVYISHYTVCVGDELTVYGSGLSANSEAEILFDDVRIASTKVGKEGSFKTLVRVPLATGGAHRISVANAGTVSSVNLNVIPSFSISPTAGNINVPVNITGTGFRGQTLVTVSYDETLVGSATSANDGSFTFSFSIPRSKSGKHTITLSDATNRAKAEFLVESVPPKSPTLLDPPDRASVKDTLRFRWEPVTDPSGISYIFQIGRDLDFTDTPINLTNYTQTEYILPAEVRLPPSGRYGYYWRVKAIDGAYNEGPWSEARSFTISITLGNWISNMPAWIKVSLLGVGLIFFAVIFFWIGTITRITIERRVLATKGTTSRVLSKTDKSKSVNKSSGKTSP